MDPVNQKSIQDQKRNIKRRNYQNNLKGKPRINLTLGITSIKLNNLVSL